MIGIFMVDLVVFLDDVFIGDSNFIEIYVFVWEDFCIEIGYVVFDQDVSLYGLVRDYFVLCQDLFVGRIQFQFLVYFFGGCIEVLGEFVFGINKQVVVFDGGCQVNWGIGEGVLD